MWVYDEILTILVCGMNDGRAHKKNPKNILQDINVRVHLWTPHYSQPEVLHPGCLESERVPPKA